MQCLPRQSGQKTAVYPSWHIVTNTRIKLYPDTTALISSDDRVHQPNLAFVIKNVMLVKPFHTTQQWLAHSLCHQTQKSFHTRQHGLLTPCAIRHTSHSILHSTACSLAHSLCHQTHKSFHTRQNGLLTCSLPVPSDTQVIPY